MKESLRPKVSIIVPVYNTEQFLIKCVDSLLRQTYDNIEIWLIDDGSTDGSPELCDEYAEKYVFIRTIHKENAGQGVARNMAIDLCDGEYIAFVDSDDSVTPDFIEKMVAACTAHDAQLCVCGYTSDSGLRKAKNCPADAVLNRERLMHRYINTGDIGGMTCNKLYHSSLFENLRFPALRANEDAYLLADAIQKTTTAVVVSDALYIQYVRAGSTEQSPFSERKLALLEADKHLIDVVEKHFPALRADAQCKYAWSICALLQKIADSNDGTYKPLFRELHGKLLSVIGGLDEERKKRFARYAVSSKRLYKRLRRASIKKKIRARCKKMLLKIKGK